MNEIAKKIQVLKLSLSVITSEDDLFKVISKNLNELRRLYGHNKSSFGKDDIESLKSIAELEENLILLRNYILIRKRLEYAERAETLLKNLQAISKKFDGYAVDEVINKEIEKVTDLAKHLPSVTSAVRNSITPKKNLDFTKRKQSPQKQYSPVYTNTNARSVSNPPAIYNPPPTYSEKHSKNKVANQELIAATGGYSNRLCTRCGQRIPQARVDLMPNVLRCVRCQSNVEETQDTRTKADEGFGGSREDIRKMKARQWGEVANRGVIGMAKRNRKKK
jgi:hypothetical protein